MRIRVAATSRLLRRRGEDGYADAPMLGLVLLFAVISITVGALVVAWVTTHYNP